MRRDLHVCGDQVDLGSGRFIHAPGPIQGVAIHGETVAILTRWIDGDPRGGPCTVRADNLYGYGLDGGLRWRVTAGDGVSRGLLLTGFLEDEDALRLHEAHGWWLTVDPVTGAVVRAQSIV